jgi:hypothetical protein
MAQTQLAQQGLPARPQPHTQQTDHLFFSKNMVQLYVLQIVAVHINPVANVSGEVAWPG